MFWVSSPSPVINFASITPFCNVSYIVSNGYLPLFKLNSNFVEELKAFSTLSDPLRWAWIWWQFLHTTTREIPAPNHKPVIWRLRRQVSRLPQSICCQIQSGRRFISGLSLWQCRGDLERPSWKGFYRRNTVFWKHENRQYRGHQVQRIWTQGNLWFTS